MSIERVYEDVALYPVRSVPVALPIASPAAARMSLLTVRIAARAQTRRLVTPGPTARYSIVLLHVRTFPFAADAHYS